MSRDEKGLERRRERGDEVKKLIGKRKRKSEREE
jgi:hypothetical protein